MSSPSNPDPLLSGRTTVMVIATVIITIDRRRRRDGERKKRSDIAIGRFEREPNIGHERAGLLIPPPVSASRVCVSF